MKIFFFFILIISLNFTGCIKKDTSPIVARVGSVVLTLDELNTKIPQEYYGYISQEQIADYVKQWINNQILYQEAKRLKIDKEKPIKERLQRMKEDILSAELISRNAIPLEEIKVPDSLIEQYYNENKSKFIREKSVVKYVQIVCDNAVTAWKVRAIITPDNFMTLASQYSKVPPPSKITDIPYVKIDELPPELSFEISNTKINGTTNVIKTDLGFCIARVLDKQPKGTQATLEEAKEEIISILASKMQNAALEKLVSSIRSRMIVEVNLDNLKLLQKNASTPIKDLQENDEKDSLASPKKEN
jgi:parvulin-like peptidyl-prolyl isomerase